MKVAMNRFFVMKGHQTRWPFVLHLFSSDAKIGQYEFNDTSHGARACVVDWDGRRFLFPASHHHRVD